MKHNFSRRNFALLLPAIAAAQNKRLVSKAYKFEDLPTKAGANSKSHAVFDGETHSGYRVEVHVTELPAGGSPHPPHHHVHEEMFLIQAGVLEATVNGKTERLTPGSVFFVNSNEEHGVRNPGPDRAEYFVVALGTDA
jgi:quercetin dioxygenase-like cupin family protein